MSTRPPSTRPAAVGSGARGRPGATSHAEIERAAFRLFTSQGFDRTTLDGIAAEVGIGRRTLFRYFASKNDIPWGRFDRTLADFRRLLRDLPEQWPVWLAVHRGVCAFNDFPADADPPHVQRMRLILGTPTLQAHSVLRYAEWRNVIGEFVAERTGCSADDLLPRTAGHISLGLTLAAYDEWLRDPGRSLPDLIDSAMSGLRQYFGH